MAPHLQRVLLSRLGCINISSFRDDPRPCDFKPSMCENRSCSFLPAVWVWTVGVPGVCEGSDGYVTACGADIEGLETTINEGDPVVGGFKAGVRREVRV